ncbi:Long-chain-fatty-acid--CoA ligase [Alteripontixanthobacter maritimus]|uniref:Long-chain-fatty-acid--CoA ligase n=1 Tax=Alteripontixanthobacter maritimus TaxID=2161824 RepID=A0A369Q5T5_9SPHN|nr:acyl-CoA ligase (AMP-forming), exosortase A system-associated [Alteripontixanthobacter maritimus]RDC60084.1 Long-chain-fatty-acid--CoA ligase [Alteripontixanthobacter maritimus]
MPRTLSRLTAENIPAADPKPLDHLAERGEAGAPAIVLREGVLTHQDLRSRVGAMASWLASQGWPHGARVASWAAKGAATCLLPLACARAGLVHVPINPLLKRAQAAHILADCNASALIATGSRLKSLNDGDVPADCRSWDEAQFLAELDAHTASLGPSTHDPDELAAILYTSGSTGLPKGVILSHANMWLGAVSVAHYLELAADDVTLAVLPLSFDYGQNQLLSTWYAGGSIVPLDYLFARDVVKACAKQGVTTLAAVPPLWLQLAELDWPTDAVRTLRRLTNSGGALTADLVTGLQTMASEADIVPMYGLTEAFRSTYLPPRMVASHPTSMGKAIPYAEVLVITDDGELAAPGKEGELVHCGPLVAQGYWQDDARTAERFKPAPAASSYGGTAVWSGDRVRRDADGLLYFVGRRDAMIKSAGNRISPAEVEQAAISTGLVAEAIALGVPDTRLGEAVHLVASHSPDGLAESDAEAALTKALAKLLPNFMQPTTIHWREQLPTNVNGKLDRAAIVADVLARQSGGAAS